MQQILIDMAVLGLFLFLFFAMSLGREDKRLRFWIAGWLCIEAQVALALWHPAGVFWQQIRASGRVDFLIVAGALFIFSGTIYRTGGVLAQYLGPVRLMMTLGMISLAIMSPEATAVLAIAVVVRQSVAVALALPSRPGRGLYVVLSVLVCSANGVWMLTGIARGHAEIVIPVMLEEVYLITAIHFFADRAKDSTATKLIIGGFLSWSAVYPADYWIGQGWPQLAIDLDVWNIPKVCVLIGMVLLVMEEDNRTARALNEDYRLLFDNNPHALWITDSKTLNFLAANQVALAMHGYTREEFLSKNLSDVVEPSVREAVLAHVASFDLRPFHSSRHVRKDGSLLHLDVTASPIEFEGRPARFVMALDSTEREELEEQLEHQAEHDALTGLPNRTLLPAMLAEALGHAKEHHEKVAVISLDIDRFKKRVNDVYGLHIGDAYIQRIASELTARMRSMDIVARTGGDEFTLVATGLKSTASADQAVSDVREIFVRPVVVHGYRIELPVSIGVAVGPDDGDEAVALWRGAESARDEAKLSGTGGVVWLSVELRKTAEEQSKLETYLRTRKDDGALQLAYQPIYARDGRVRSMEALLRLNHPEFGAVSPGKLIPIAEEAGLIVPLGEWVVEEVSRQLLIWRSQGMELVPVAVNASGLQVMHEDFASHLLSTLERYAIDPHLIHIEVTESVAMRNGAGVAEHIAALSGKGIAFSIDDFGTGHSSLARLGDLGASILKIDRSFVMQPTESTKASSIVQAIITMAHTLGHTVVAEGVETEQQLEGLLELDCDLYQGYLLSPPVSPDKIPDLVGGTHEAFRREPESLRLVKRIRA